MQEVRILDNRKEKTTFTIIDARSITMLIQPKERYGAGKKVSDIRKDT